MTDQYLADAQISGMDPADGEKSHRVQELAPLEGMTDEEFAELASTVMVVIPYRQSEGISVGICQHFGMWGRIGLRLATLKDPFGGFIEMTRGGIVKMFLDFCQSHPKVKYLVMIDSDETIAWDAPLRLAQHGLPIITGVVCGYSPERGIFACFCAKDENGVPRFPSFADTKMLPAAGVAEVEICGTGLLCVRRDVLETMVDADEEPFFIPEEHRRESVRQGNLRKGEDIVFCERAKRFGFKRYVDFSVHAGHYKNIQIGWPTDQIDPDLEAIDWKPSKFDYRGVID